MEELYNDAIFVVVLFIIVLACFYVYLLNNLFVTISGDNEKAEQGAK